MNLYFTSETRNCLDLFGTPMAQNHMLSGPKYTMTAFSSKCKYRKVHPTNQTLVILRCCFAEKDKEMYVDL